MSPCVTEFLVLFLVVVFGGGSYCYCFQSLDIGQPQRSLVVGKKAENKTRNRYANIITCTYFWNAVCWFTVHYINHFRLFKLFSNRGSCLHC